MLPNDLHGDEFASQCYVIIDKARHMLGYEPAVNFARGMDLTADYLRQAYDLVVSLTRRRGCCFVYRMC